MASTPDREPLWKRCLDFDRQEVTHYGDYVQAPLFELIDGEPRRVLDLGCATGAFGAALLQRFPGAPRSSGSKPLVRRQRRRQRGWNA